MVQLRGGGILDIVRRHVAQVGDGHGDLLGLLPGHLHGDPVRVPLVGDGTGGDVAGQNDVVGELMLAGSLDLGQVRHNLDVAGVDLADVMAVAGDGNVDPVFVLAQEHHAALGGQDALALQAHGDIVDGLLVVRIDVADHIEPKAQGDGHGQKEADQLVICHCASPPYR